MTWSQMLVVTWIEFILAACLLLFLARRSLSRLPQPVDRIRLILFALTAAATLPLLLTLTPWTAWRLQVIAPMEGQTVRVESEAPVHSGPADIISPDRLYSQQRWDMPPTPLDVAPAADQAPAAHDFPQAATVIASTPSARWTSNDVWAGAAWAILGLHGLALLVYFAQSSIGAFQLQRWWREAAPGDEPLAQIWSTLTTSSARQVQLLVTPAIDVPLMFGWWRPVVLIPQTLAERGGPVVRYCLAHEWAHIARGDMVAWRWVRLCQILFWLIPSYWKLRKELRLCQDLLADQCSTGAAGDAVEYSELLVGFARQRMSARVAGALTFLDQPSQLTRRIKMLLECPISVRFQCTWRFSILAAAAAGLFAAGISGVRIEARQGQNDFPPDVRRSQETHAEQSKTRAEQKVAASDREKSAEKADTPDVPKKEEPVTLTYMCSVVDRETGKGIPNARVTVRRSILTAQENRILEESKHTTDAEGKYEVVIPPEQVATPWLYIELDVVHDDYAWKKGFGYALSMIRKNEKLGERPFFERTELYPGEAVSGTVVSPDGKPLEGVLALGYSRGNRRDFESGSFTEAKTAADGSFRVIFHKGVDAVLWVIPKEHAPVHQFVARQRGDLGVIEVSTGIRVAGRVVGVDGKAIAGAPVNVEFAGEQNVGDLPVGTSIQRAALSDADGRFQLDPLPAGEYRVTVEEHLADPLARDRTRYSVSEVFLPKKIVLKEGVEQALLEVQAVPHIVIHAQNLDSAGKRTKGHEFHLFGQLDGESWFGQGKPNLDGTAVLNVPHGLQEAQMQLVANEHGALRYRRGKDQPLQDDVSRIRLGTLNDDIEDFEIIYYKAPIALVSAVDEAQQQIPKLQVKATYARPRPDAYIAFENKSDIYFEHQKDGKYRTRQMLPDEDVTFTVTAEGYGSVEERINLKEGETKELVVTLRKNADNESR